MRRAVLTLAALATVGLATGTALAQSGDRGYYGPPGQISIQLNQQIYVGAAPGLGYGYRAPGARYGYRAPGRGYGYRGFGLYSGSDPHTSAVRRIMATHSRYRYNPHPRSYYKSPPHRYDYWGW